MGPYLEMWQRFRIGVGWLIPLLAAFVSVSTALAVSQALPETELQTRIRAAADAQKADNLAAAAYANRRVIAFALAQLAEVRLSQVEAAAAVELYRQSIELEDVPETRYRYAISLMATGQTDAALRQTAQVVEHDPKNPAAWSLQGKLWMTKKEYQPAADSFLRSLALQSDWGTAYNAATALLKLHQTTQAAALFKQMDETGMNPVRLHIMAGRVYEFAGFPDDAEREYKRAIAIDPKDSHGHYSLALMDLTRNSWAPTPEARRELEIEVSLNPHDYYGNFLLGYVASVEKSYDESDRHLKTSAAANPDVPEPYLYLGLNAYGRDDYDGAEAALRKAIQLTGADESRNYYQIRRAYFTLGRSLIQLGHKAEATQCFEKARQMEAKLLDSNRQKVLDSSADEPEKFETPTLNNSHLSAKEKSVLESAEQDLRAILGNAYNNWGISDARLQKYTPALAHFQAAERWYPQTPGVMRNLGLAAFLANDDAESARALHMVVEEDPSDQQSQSMLAMSLFSLKKYTEAVQVFDRIDDHECIDSRLCYEWAFSLIQIQRQQRASEILERLTSQPLPAEMLVRAGRLYSDLGKPENAEACFRKALAQDPAVKIAQ